AGREPAADPSDEDRDAAAGAGGPECHMAELDAERGEKIVEQRVDGGADQPGERRGDGVEELRSYRCPAAQRRYAEAEYADLQAVAGGETADQGCEQRPGLRPVADAGRGAGCVGLADRA